jgi:hypothetical protein
LHFNRGEVSDLRVFLFPCGAAVVMLGEPIARKEDAVQPPTKPDAVTDEAAVETDPDLALFIDSLVWEEPDAVAEEE